jgi:competence protein ComEA helix-hairpin-helix repeat region
MSLKIILGVVIATIIGLIIMQIIDPNIIGSIFNTSETTDTDDTSTDGTGSFSITGYVVNPGKYNLTIEGASMEDLINSAGGATSNADDRCYYLDATILENESYYIPTKYDVTNVCGSDEIEKVNINSDNSSKLQEISGIGSVIADAIIDYRETNGLFYTLEGLLNVSGIGNSKFTQIKDYVILHE